MGHVTLTKIVYCRYLGQNDLQESPIVYLSPEMAKQISFFGWDLSNNYNFMLQTIPHNIYRYFRTSNMGIFDKLIPKFKQMAQKR